MKKKGLIVATIVMVLVLAVSLTTATYAWFTTTAKTSIQGFDVQVQSNNLVNIGLKGSSYVDGSSADEFVSGECVYTRGAGNGSTGYTFGTWSGTTSLAPSITATDVNWGTQSTAVGFMATANQEASAATGSNTLFVPNIATNVFTPIAANGTGTSTISGTPELAYENYTSNNNQSEPAEVAGSFAYLFLGVQATKALLDGSNKFTIVLVPQGSGQTVGIASAIHVAYRLKKAADASFSNWTDVDIYDTKHYGDSRSTVAAVELNGDLTTDFTESTDTYSSSTKKTTAPTGSAALSLQLSNYSDTSAAAPIDQIELIIYLAGHDSDCINSAINNSQTKVYMFFEAQAATA